MTNGLILNRVSFSEKCTMGVLLGSSGLPICLTLENPWLDNEPCVSCIPDGDYTCEIVTSPKYGKVYGVKDVDNRTHILFHAGNTEKDTKGCILLGRSYGVLSGEPAVLSSRNALTDFHTLMDGKPFDLQITSALYQL